MDTRAHEPCKVTKSEFERYTFSIYEELLSTVTVLLLLNFAFVIVML